MSGIVGSRFNIRGSGLVGSLGTDGQVFTSSGAGAGAVFETAASTDLTPVRQDVSTLALHSAVADNKVAYNLANAFIDQFEDSTGILTETDVDNIDEYVNTQSRGAGADTTLSSGNFTAIGGAFVSGTGAIAIDDAIDAYAYYKSAPADYGDGWVYDFGATVHFTKARFYNFSSVGRFKDWKIFTSPDNSTYTEQNMTASDSSSGSNTSPLVAADSNNWNTGTLTTSLDTRYIRMMFDDNYNNGNDTACFSEIQLFTSALADHNATGTLISTAHTAPAQTKLSGVILYKDNVGTATIGTDLKIYLSADNGSNFTETGYTAVTPVFSSGIKMVRLNETTVTSGTVIKIKAVWANQSKDSKETELHGWAVNY